MSDYTEPLEDMMNAWVKNHRKLLVTLTGGLLTVAEDAFGPSNTWVMLAIAAGTAFGVYRVPNTKPPVQAAPSPGPGPVS